MVELVFVGTLAALRVMNMGWMLILFGLLLVVWIIFHLGLMTAFVVGIRLSIIDVLLYLALHFFYLAAWLFQSDGGDSGAVRSTIEVLFDNDAFAAFLQKWGDNVFWVAMVASVICYLVIGILLIVRLVRRQRARRLVPQPV